MPLALDLGTVPDWISVLLALVSAGAAGLAYLLNRRNRALGASLDARDIELRNALQEIEIQKSQIEIQRSNIEVQRSNAALERERAAGFDQLSDQARLVVVTENPDRSTNQKRRYRVTNGSGQAIYDLAMKLVSDQRKLWTVHLPYLAAGATHEPSSPHPGVFGLDLRFRDFRGNWWHLDGYSTLRQLPPDYRPRIGVAPPGTFDE